MRNIAANRDRQAVQTAFGAADCQRIQQGLGRVFMATVTCVQHSAVHLFRQQINRARLWVAHDQKVGVHCVQCQGRINQGFALFNGRCPQGHVHHIRAQPFSGQFETGLGTGGVFKKHVDLCQACQNIGMLIGLAV